MGKVSNTGCNNCPTEEEPVKITGELLVLEGGKCELRLYVDGVTCPPIDLTPILSKIPEASSSTVVDNGNGTATVTQTDGTQCAVIKAGTVSTVVAGANGTITITQTDGTAATAVTGIQSTVTDNGDGTGTVTQNDGTVCTFLKQVDIPADVRVADVQIVESADGSSHSVQLVLSNGTTLNGGPVIDQWSTVTDNGDGSGTVEDPTGSACTFAKGTASTVTDNGDGTGTVTQNDGTVCTFLKQVDIPADVRVADVQIVESADGSSHSVQLVLSNGTTLNGGPVIDQWSTVTDNGDGTGTVTDPNNNSCRFVKGPLTCEPGDDEGTIKIGGLQFEVKPYVNEEYIIVTDANATTFTGANAVGDVFEFAAHNFSVPGCSPRLVRFTGAMSLTVNGPASEVSGAQLDFEYSINGSEWTNLRRASKGNTTNIYKPISLVREEETIDINFEEVLPPGNYTVRIRWELTVNDLANGEIRRQASAMCIDAGHVLVCC
jgi:hypothetical protein